MKTNYQVIGKGNLAPVLRFLPAEVALNVKSSYFLLRVIDKLPSTVPDPFGIRLLRTPCGGDLITYKRPQTFSHIKPQVHYHKFFVELF